MVDRRETMSLGVPIGRGSKEVELILRPNYEFQVKRFRENGTLLGGYEQAKAEVGDIISRIVASNAGEEEVKALLQEALPPVFESYGFILEGKSRFVLCTCIPFTSSPRPRRCGLSPSGLYAE